MTLVPYLVSDVPAISYCPDFISVQQEEALVRNITSSKSTWKEVKGRRVQNFGGTVEQGILLQIRLPCSPNHVLLNAYQPGQGIYSHQDGPIYHPGVCILSLGSSAVVNFRRKLPKGGYESTPSAQIMLQRRSLLTFSDEAYSDCLHGIDDVSVDKMHSGIANLWLTEFQAGQCIKRRGERFSLTVRHVLNTRKNLIRL